jgi:hypothetical protein
MRLAADVAVGVLMQVRLAVGVLQMRQGFR